MDNLGGCGGLYDVYFGLKIRNMKEDILKNFWIQALHDDDHDREDRFFVFLQSELNFFLSLKHDTFKIKKNNSKYFQYGNYIRMGRPSLRSLFSTQSSLTTHFISKKRKTLNLIKIFLIGTFKMSLQFGRRSLHNKNE